MAHTSVRFIKGHGTENDFIVLLDPAGELHLEPHHVQHLCHRRRGIGADGILRAVRSAQHPDALPMAAEAEWFMDYWNPDGTVAAMCGNGIRLFARALAETGLAKLSPAGLPIATRAGIRHVHIPTTHPSDAAKITVDMGHARLPGPDTVTVTANSCQWAATHVDMGNPHAVAFVTDLSEIGDLLTPPTVRPATAYPQGVTVEFVTRSSPGHLAMRVHERGAGETRSCGTGACAAVIAALVCDGIDPYAPGHGIRYEVSVPGGQLQVTVLPNGGIELTGPAEITAEGTVALEQPDQAGNGRRVPSSPLVDSVT
ncbi:diaminopimelate epimerase [Streptomyces sp. NPDC050095]|uniref:diaminopimelate epimerase n=1 Tax=unclassified Streptomyces TaxID=2593676 RepID=UPI00342D5574